MNSHSTMCYMCKLIHETDEELVTCTSCRNHFHPICLDANNDMLTIIKTYSWQCIDCKSCAKCNKTHDEVSRQLLLMMMMQCFFLLRQI